MFIFKIIGGMFTIFNTIMMFSFLVICVLAYLVVKKVLSGESFTEAFKSIIQLVMSIITLEKFRDKDTTEKKK